MSEDKYFNPGNPETLADLQQLREVGMIGEAEFEKQKRWMERRDAGYGQEEEEQEVEEEAANPNEEEDQPFEAGITETQPDKNGVKTTTEFRQNAAGIKQKIVRKVRVQKKQRKIKPEVLARRELTKFGKVRNMKKGPEQGVTAYGDEVQIALPMDDKQEEKKPQDKNYAVSCRHCGAVGDHWTMQCPYKDRLIKMDDITGEDSNGEELALSQRSGSGKYQAPGRRGGARRLGGPTMLDKNRAQEISTTIRVTNVSEETTENDLRELFGRFGALQRVFLAKNNFTQLSRGFAFVSFYDRRPAEKAMEALQGHGYDSLVLRLEWATSNNNRR